MNGLFLLLETKHVAYVKCFYELVNNRVTRRLLEKDYQGLYGLLKEKDEIIEAYEKLIDQVEDQIRVRDRQIAKLLQE